MSKEGYKSHRPGTRKGIVHKIFDEKGDEAAMKKGISANSSRARSALSFTSSRAKGTSG